VKRAHQYVNFEAVPFRSNQVKITNKYAFISLEGFAVNWTLLENGIKKSSGTFRPGPLSPGESQMFKLDGLSIGAETEEEYHLNFQLVSREDSPLVPAGHVFAIEQFRLNPGLPSMVNPEDFEPNGSGKITLNESVEKVVIGLEDGEIVFDRTSGFMESYMVAGVELLSSGPRPNFWRAPTENDFGNKMPERCAMWKTFGSELQLQALVPLQSGDMTMLTAEYIHPEFGSNYRVTYQFNSKGRILVHVKFNPLGNGLPEIPRFGMQIVVPEGYNQLEYFGRGPHENHIDRNSSSLVGLYKGTVEEQYVPYITNGENGNKTETRWLSLTNGNGRGIRIGGNPLFDFSALHYAQDDLDRKVRDGAHTIDLEKSGKVFLNVDWKQMGVGGDNSWGARTHAAYVLEPGPLEYSFIIVPQ